MYEYDITGRVTTHVHACIRFRAWLTVFVELAVPKLEPNTESLEPSHRLTLLHST